MIRFEKISKYSYGDMLYWKKTNIVSLHVKIEKNIPSFTINNKIYIERCTALMSMIKDTLLIYKINDVEIIINVTDTPYDNPFFLHFSKKSDCNINVVPNFSLYNWSDAKSSNFFETKNQILKHNIEWKNKEDMIMWSGLNTSKIRNKMNTIKSSEINYNYNLIIDYKNKHTFIDLKDHSKYKYLLDMEGIGYSGRFPYLALTGSCVIILENIKNDYKYYYNHLFIENTHYLKVQYNDDDDIIDINKNIINKIKTSNCEEIGKKCQSIAIEVFSKEKILSYFNDILSYYSEYYDPSNERLNTLLKYNTVNIDKKKMFYLINK
jgi:plasmid maintenance system killer protein